MNNGPYGPTPAPLAPSGYQPQGSGGPGGPPYGGMPPADETMAWVAVASSSLSWVSCCCGVIPIVGLFGAAGGMLLAIVGVVCGYLALQKAKQQNSRTDIAMIGLVLGAVRLGLTALVLVGIFVAVAMGVGVGILEGITHPQ